MEKHIYYIIVAFILVTLIPLMRHVIELRIAVFKWLRWKSMAEIHRRSIDRLTLVVRLILVPVIIYLFYLGYSGLTS